MPNAYVINQRPVTYGGAISLLVEMLVSAGWTYQSSGDGLAGFSSSGKIFTGTGTGALGWSNAKAWARIQDPATSREFIFQHDNTGQARIKYSANAKFTGGSPSATVTPSATDEKYLRGGATDAAPTYGTWFNTSTVTTAPYGGAVTAAATVVGSVIYQGAALSASPYGFWFASQLHDGAKTKGASILFDPVNSAPEDTDPYVLVVGSTQSFLFNATASPTNGLGKDGGAAATWTIVNGTNIDGAWAYMDAARTSFLNVQPAGYAAQSGTQTPNVSGSSGLLANPFNSKYEALPVPWMRTASAASIPGLKGWSTMLRWTCSPYTTFLDTFDNKNWICVGSFWLPWNGATQPLS